LARDEAKAEMAEMLVDEDVLRIKEANREGEGGEKSGGEGREGGEKECAITLLFSRKGETKTHHL